MKTAVLAFVFCIAFASANMSLLDHLIKHTKVTGKVDLNTKEGVGFDYKGGVDYEDDIVKLDLLKIGAKFNAVPEKQPEGPYGNHTQHAVRYEGAFDIKQGKETAHVATNGVAKMQADWQVGDDKSITYQKLLENTNAWNATHNDHFLAGNATAAMGAKGKVKIAGNNIHVQEQIRGAARAEGSLGFLNGTFLGNFSAGKEGQAVVQKQIVWNKNATGNQPNFTFRGAAAFNKKEALKWNNDTWGHAVQGQARVGGNGWAKVNVPGQGNTTHSGIMIDKDVQYQYKAAWGKNGKALGQEAGAGVVDVVRRLNHHDQKNGSHEFTLFGNGRWAHAANTVINDKKKPAVTVERLDGEEMSFDEVKDLSKGEFNDHYDEKKFEEPLPDFKELDAKVIKSKVNVVWKDGAITDVDPNQEKQGHDVHTTAGSAWLAQGEDNVHGKWKNEGNRTMTADFLATDGGQQVKDVEISFGHNEGLLSKIANTAAALQRFMDRFRGE